MISELYWVMNSLDLFFWGFVSFALILVLGFYFTFKTRAFQLRSLFQIVRTFFHFSRRSIPDSGGIHPIRLFFTSVGGMIGIGNIVGIVTAVQFGGPGALFWVWMTGLVGSVIKYAEIYLGFKYRTPRPNGNGYEGGPMHVLKQAFKNPIFSILLSIFLCVYCVEVYQFSVMVESLYLNFHVERWLGAIGLLVIILYVVIGGVHRVTQYCMFINPLMMGIYCFMCLWVIGTHVSEIPALLKTVILSAFTGHAAVGGFAGSSALLAIRYGVGRTAYSSDIGMGYDSSIQVESNVTEPENQAKLAIFGVYVDNMICSLTLLVVLISGVWSASPMIEPSLLVQAALVKYFPFVVYLLPLFFFVAGFTNVVAYFSVGVKTARYLFPKHGRKLYLTYGMMAMPLFAFLGGHYALMVMSLSGAALLILNLIGIFRLRKEIAFVRDISPIPPLSNAADTESEETQFVDNSIIQKMKI